MSRIALLRRYIGIGENACNGGTLRLPHDRDIVGAVGTAIRVLTQKSILCPIFLKKLVGAAGIEPATYPV
jgi:hypothetical protein